MVTCISQVRNMRLGDLEGLSLGPTPFEWQGQLSSPRRESLVLC